MKAREQLSRTNLLARSVEKFDFAGAVKEWEFTGDMLEFTDRNARCELCEQEQLRYQFEICNANGNRMHVGSRCIEKFNILVKDRHGNVVTGKVALYLDELVRETRRTKAIQRLLASTTTKMIGGYPLKQLDADIATKGEAGIANARVVNYLFMRLEEENIPYEPRDYRITFKTFDDKSKLLSLRPKQFKRVLLVLTTKQVTYYKNAKSDARVDSQQRP